MIIRPYRKAGQWVFSDPEKVLVDEPFIKGSGEIIEAALRRAKIWPGSHHGFRLEVTDESHDGWEHANFLRAENGGAWYECQGMHGYLCPAPLYFPEPPAVLWFWVRSLRTAAETTALYRASIASLSGPDLDRLAEYS